MLLNKLKFNVRVLQYSTNKWLTTKEDLRAAFKDILEGSQDYSYNKTMVWRTIEYFNFEI